MLEFLYFPKLNINNIPGFINFNDTDVIKSLMSENRGLLFLSGHYSNWELTAYSYSLKHIASLKIIAKKQASRRLNEKINEYRMLGGNEIIQTGYSLRAVYEMLNNNEQLCFLIDQSANPDYSVYVNFFGQSVATFSGPAKIALRKKPGLVIGYAVRNSDYKYEMFFEKVEYDDLNEYNNENILKLTQRIQTGFENVIRKNPGQWLWLHKRFKHTKNV